MHWNMPGRCYVGLFNTWSFENEVRLGEGENKNSHVPMHWYSVAAGSFISREILEGARSSAFRSTTEKWKIRRVKK